MAKRLATVAAVAAIVATSAMVVSGPASAAPSAGPVRVPLAGVFRLCDHSAKTYVPTVGNAQGVASVSTAGNTVIAQVTFGYAPPNTHYTVRLIQTPLPSTRDCGPGVAGVAVGALDTDQLGNGQTTVQDTRRAGATGAWVFIDRAAEFSQIPAEHYTSDFIAPLGG
ncbi:hypothetical protein TUM20985_41950 [Mycobacterium antarcticum]|uniref:hypothetical protein n=1 Tax=Mycolicibacterium sp. TUM20985 TaxID=3023370 RepID=UPI0025736FB0|nr:hypothetical protein [Mycolicibacterium sp. TUM20985]BDX33648.1 hypothetical protein TUM20985_41950 [Mycolicibacterium sp. TUM20985]